MDKSLLTPLDFERTVQYDEIEQSVQYGNGVVVMRPKLKNERLKRGMSYKDVAEAISLTERAYRYIENGERDPSWASAQKLRSLFGISSDELLVQDSTPKSVTA